MRGRTDETSKRCFFNLKAAQICWVETPLTGITERSLGLQLIVILIFEIDSEKQQRLSVQKQRKQSPHLFVCGFSPKVCEMQQSVADFGIRGGQGDTLTVDSFFTAKPSGLGLSK